MKNILWLTLAVFIIAISFTLFTILVGWMSGNLNQAMESLSPGLNQALKFSAITLIAGSLWKLWESDKRKWRRKP